MNGLEYESVGVVVSAQAILIYPVVISWGLNWNE